MREYKISIYKGQFCFCRKEIKGEYKGRYLMLLNARDKNFKEVKENKHWFSLVKYENLQVDFNYIDEIEEFAKSKGYEFEIIK